MLLYKVELEGDTKHIVNQFKVEFYAIKNLIVLYIVLYTSILSVKHHTISIVIMVSNW